MVLDSKGILRLSDLILASAGWLVVWSKEKTDLQLGESVRQTCKLSALDTCVHLLIF